MEKISKQSINILFLLPILSLCGPLTLQIYPLKWEKKWKTAPFRLSFPQAVLGSLFQTTSEKDFVFSCSSCLHWLREGRQCGELCRGPSLPAPSTAAAGPCSRPGGRGGADISPSYLCWGQMAVDLFAKSAASWVSLGSKHWGLILMGVPWVHLQSQ